MSRAINLPGATIRRLRKERGWSLAELGERCSPPLDRSTLCRLEKRNKGYTQDTLERIAGALGVKVCEFFWPPQLRGWEDLPEAAQQRLAQGIEDAVIRYRLERGKLTVS